MVGLESPSAHGRCLVAALVAAGNETLQVPPWRTHRERHRQRPGKTDPSDAISIAQVMLRKRRELGPAMEPELVHVLGMLELAWSATAPRRSSACAPTGPSSIQSPRPASSAAS